MEIRCMQEADRKEVLSMMKVFYNSAAVFTNGSYDIFVADIDACLSNSPFLEGYVFEENDEVLGYAMVAKSFSTEFGKPCVWLEDLYLKEFARGRGIIPSFFKFIETENPNAVFRLEVEKENEHAVHVYRKAGFTELPYLEMKR